MSETKQSYNDVLPLESSDRWLVKRLDSMVSAGFSLHFGLNLDADLKSILELTRNAVNYILKFDATGFDWFNEDGLVTNLVYCFPQSASGSIRTEIDYQVENGFVGMAIKENHPVLAPACTIEGRQVLIAPLVTPKTTLGFFMGITGERFVPDVCLKMISLLLLNCASAIETNQLYKDQADYNRSLEKQVVERTRALTKAKETLAETNDELVKKNSALEKSLFEIKTLRGILPICSFCKKIRDDDGYWEQVDQYLRANAEVEVSHSICPNCLREHYPDDADSILRAEDCFTCDKDKS